jgi:hypothetical protein
MNMDEAQALSDKLITVINDKQQKYSNTRFHYNYVENEQKARFIIKTLELIN